MCDDSVGSEHTHGHFVAGSLACPSVLNEIPSTSVRTLATYSKIIETLKSL